jgi:NAD(P)H-dependent FMN reductase
MPVMRPNRCPMPHAPPIHGYGSAGGARAVEHLRLIMAELMVATVRAQVMLSLLTERPVGP